MVLTHVKRGQPLNEDVFEVSVLHFIIVSFKRFYDEYLVRVFLHCLLKFKLLDDFFPSKTNANLCMFVVGVCVCTPIE